MKTIIEMAREAGFSEWAVKTPRDLERFAELVRADERDRMCEQFNISKELAHEKAKGNETD
jgi:hypothetical protein